MRRLVCRYPFEAWACTCCGCDQDRPPVSVSAGMICERCLDRGMRGEPFIPLTVRMVQPKRDPDQRPVVAVSMRDGQVMIEGDAGFPDSRTGEVFGLDDLPGRLLERAHGGGGAGRRGYVPAEQLPPAIVTTDAGIELLAYLSNQPELTANPLFQWQVALKSLSAWRPEARSRHRYEFVIPKPVRFGFASQRGGKRRAHGLARWYQLIDVHLFCELPDGFGETDLAELLRFGVQLREWSNAEQLPVMAGASAYGARLLRDARFGGGWRRKVPRGTNDRLRRMLPGNHYQLLVAEDRRLPVVHKFDQHRAHHTAAMMARFPHPDTLEARGMFRSPPIAGRRGPFRRGDRRWRELVHHPGLFIAAVDIPAAAAADPLILPQLRRAGVQWRTLTSVEFGHLPAGARLLDIWCAWSSPDTDERLNEYAWWAGQQLDRPNVPRWLKPTLLAAYGMLAVKARAFRNAWRWCASDKGIGWHTTRGMLIGFERAGDREREPQTANVLNRILIESQVRAESLKFARELRAAGMQPVAVYADAVFATGDRPASTRAPWRYEGPIHDLTFESPARYRSREETRLPGTPKRRDRLTRAIATRGGDEHGDTTRQQPPARAGTGAAPQPPA